MSKYSIIFLIILIVFICKNISGLDAKITKFPNTIQRCRAGDVKCIAIQINHLFKTGGQRGYPELELPPVDPLYWKKPIDIIFDGNSGTAANVKIHNTNTTFIGLSTVKVIKVIGFDVDPKESKFEIHMFAPFLHTLAEYKATARILSIPIIANGRSNSTLENFKCIFKLHPSVTKRNGQEYVHFDKIQVNFNVSRFYINFQSYMADQVFNDVINNILNENWREILNDLRLPFADSIENLIKSIVLPLFDNIPYQEFFLNYNDDADADDDDVAAAVVDGVNNTTNMSNITDSISTANKY